MYQEYDLDFSIAYQLQKLFISLFLIILLLYWSTALASFHILFGDNITNTMLELEVSSKESNDEYKNIVKYVVVCECCLLFC